MEINSLLKDDFPVGRILRYVLDSNALTTFKFGKDKMGYGKRELRDGFTHAIQTFKDSPIKLEKLENDELCSLLRKPCASISPLVVVPDDVFDISTKLKYRLHKALSCNSDSFPSTVRLEMLLDSVSYGCHIVSRDLEFSYRDHYVHPVAVAALGVHTLLHNGANSLLSQITDMLWDSKQGKRLLENCSPDGIGCLDQDLLATDDVAKEVVKLRRRSFVLLTWIIAAVYHDIGRHLLTMAQIQASNTYQKGDTLSPVFYNYASTSCFGKKNRVSKLCRCHYPRKEYLKPYLEFVQRVCSPAFPLVKGRLKKGGLAGAIKGLGRKDHPDDADHAFLSSLTLFTWANILQKDAAKKAIATGNGMVSVGTALRLASASVLIHHLGSDEETKEALFGITAFDENPLGVLLRVVDFFHSACRPFVSRYKPDVKGDLVQTHKIEVKLYDTVDLIALAPNLSNKPLAFDFEIRSCLKHAIERSAEGSLTYEEAEDEIDKVVKKKVTKFENETETLDNWLKGIGTGTQLKVWHLGEEVLSGPEIS